MTLGEHSRIVFYSDGITEAEVESGEEYGAGASAGPDAIARHYAGESCWRMSRNSRMEPGCATMLP